MESLSDPIGLEIPRVLLHERGRFRGGKEEDLLDLAEKATFTDVCFVVQNGTVNCHSVFLKKVSPFWKYIIEDHEKSYRGETLAVVYPNGSQESLISVMNILYKGQITVDGQVEICDKIESLLTELQIHIFIERVSTQVRVNNPSDHPPENLGTPSHVPSSSSASNNNNSCAEKESASRQPSEFHDEPPVLRIRNRRNQADSGIESDDSDAVAQVNSINPFNKMQSFVPRKDDVLSKGLNTNMMMDQQEWCTKMAVILSNKEWATNLDVTLNKKMNSNSSNSSTVADIIVLSDNTGGNSKQCHNKIGIDAKKQDSNENTTSLDAKINMILSLTEEAQNTSQIYVSNDGTSIVDNSIQRNLKAVTKQKSQDQRSQKVKRAKKSKPKKPSLSVSEISILDMVLPKKLKKREAEKMFLEVEAREKSNRPAKKNVNSNCERKEKPFCVICKKALESREKLQLHYCNGHFSEQLQKMFPAPRTIVGKDLSECNVCRTTMKSVEYLRHVGTQHSGLSKLLSKSAIAHPNQLGERKQIQENVQKSTSMIQLD